MLIVLRKYKSNKNSIKTDSTNKWCRVKQAYDTKSIHSSHTIRQYISGATHTQWQHVIEIFSILLALLFAYSTGIRVTKSPNLHAARLVLQLSLPNLFDPVDKSRTEMGDEQFYCLQRCDLYWKFDGSWIPFVFVPIWKTTTHQRPQCSQVPS